MNPPSRTRSSRRGVGLIELLVALAISAALLTATAVAIDASMKSYSINQEQASLMQRARLAMHRIQTYVRSCAEHGPVTDACRTQFASGLVVSDAGITMLDDDGRQIEFAFDPDGERLIASEDGTEHVLLRGVTAFEVTLEPIKSATAVKTGGQFDRLLRASIRLTVRSIGHAPDAGSAGLDQSLTFSASAMPRRNCW